MQFQLDELLTTLETLTADAQSSCATDMQRTYAIIEERSLLLKRLVDFIQHADVIPHQAMGRIRDIETSGDKLLRSVRNGRDQLRGELSDHARLRSFVGRVSGILNPPPESKSFDL